MSTNDPSTNDPSTNGLSTNDPSTNWPLSVGDSFPDVELIDHEGERWRPSPGRPLVLILHRHLA